MFARTSLNTLQSDILRTVLYFDVFSSPLSMEELFRFLPGAADSPENVTECCRTPPLANLLRQEGDFVQLRDRPSYFSARSVAAERAHGETRKARFVAQFLRHVPFIRGIFLSGELSKGIASKGSDLDFVFVTAPGRVWLVRTILSFVKYTLFMGSKRFLCMNYIVSEGHLRHEVHNRFTAIEIATLQPLVGFDVFVRYMDENDWIQEFLPNAVLRNERPGNHPSSTLQRGLEWCFTRALSANADVWLLELWRRIWVRRYPALTDDEREHQFCTLPYRSTAYGSDHMTHILKMYDSLLMKYCVVPD